MAFTLDHGKTFNEEDEDFMHASLLVSSSVLPMTLKVAIELDLLEIIAKAGPEAQLSPAQIASQLPTQNPDAAAMVERILRILASYSILRCSLFTHENGPVGTLYGLAPVCKFLTRNQEGVSVAPLLLLLQDKVFMESWYHMKDVVLNGGCPFDKAYGMTAFEYPATDPRFNEVFNSGMSGPTTIIMRNILKTYKGFDGLHELLDVGGGNGSSIHLIISNHPHIKGLNYDLPHVIAKAPAYSGVEHIGGDMFESVPCAEAIFMKSILHDWSDKQCVKLLKNCYESLPETGKVIIVESLLPSFPETNLNAKSVFHQDMHMLALNPGGKERTKKQYESLAKGAGFASLIVVCSAYGSWVMECYKM